MRHYLRLSSLGIFSAIGALALFFFWENVSKALDELGWNTFFYKGATMINELGYGAWILAAFLVSLGFVGGTWLDYVLRKILNSPAKSASIQIDFRHYMQEPSASNAENIHAWLASGMGKEYEIFVVFDKPIIDPYIVVMVDQKQATWSEVSSTDRLVNLKVKCRYEYAKVYLDFIASSEIKSGSRRQLVGVENDAIFVDRASS